MKKWPLVVLALLWLASKRERKGSAAMTLQPNQFAPSIRAWEVPLIEHGSEAVAPIAFLMSWIAVESGGNPCAVGDPAARGGDGLPYEVGIWQLDPGNRQIAGATAAALRPCCANSGTTRAELELCNRGLTADEITVQIASGLQYVKWCRSVVDESLAATRTPWLYPSVDYLRAVKSIHGSPWVMRSGLATVAKRLGRGPSSFVELSDNLRGNIPGDTPRLRGSQSVFLQLVLDNAMKTAT